jgi:hypothetical protein
MISLCNLFVDNLSNFNPMIKLFISHASEDKAEIAEPLTAALKHDFDVWFDQEKLTAGDSLRLEIARGLAHTDYGVVIFSPHFLRKYWTQAELGALTALESRERKVIIPILWQTTIEEVKRLDPIMADRVMIDGSLPISKIVDAIKLATGSAQRAVQIERMPQVTDRLKALEQKLSHQQRAEQMSHTEEGVQKVRAAACELFEFIQQTLGSSGEPNSALSFSFETTPGGTLIVNGPHRISCVINFRVSYTNSLDSACAEFFVVRYVPFEYPQVGHTFADEKRIPWFDPAQNVVWRLQDDFEDVLNTTAFAERIINAILDAIEGSAVDQ